CQSAGATLFLPDSELYTSGIDASSAGGSITELRQFHTATLLANGDVLVAGGGGHAFRPLGTSRLYNHVTHTWSQAGSLATPRLWHTATLLRNGDVLVTGGVPDSGP